jgi:hypothetical protein
MNQGKRTRARPRAAVALALLAAGTSLAACSVDTIRVGDPCDDDRDQMCDSPTSLLYCRSGHWFERDCWSECRYAGYEVGSCELHSRFADETCICAPGEVWGLGAACAREGDAQCYGPQVLRICIDGAVREIDCVPACAGRGGAACAYDSAVGDDSCVCCDTADCP